MDSQSMLKKTGTKRTFVGGYKAAEFALLPDAGILSVLIAVNDLLASGGGSDG